MLTKKCITCGDYKELDDFYAHKEMADGHLNKCKKCVKAYQNKRRLEKEQDPAWMAKERERHRIKSATSDRASRKVYSRRKYYKKGEGYKTRYPEKAKAIAVSQRIKAPKGYHKHHWSYRVQDAHDILIIAIQNHYDFHRYTIYDQERMQYRSLDGVLLDTKASYIKYVTECLTDEGITIDSHNF